MNDAVITDPCLDVRLVNGTLCHDFAPARIELSDSIHLFAGIVDLRIGYGWQPSALQGRLVLEGRKYRCARRIRNREGLAQVFSGRWILECLERYRVQLLLRHDDKVIALNVGEHRLDEIEKQLAGTLFIKLGLGSVSPGD